MEGRDGESAREVGAEVEDELWRGGGGAWKVERKAASVGKGDIPWEQ